MTPKVFLTALCRRDEHDFLGAAKPEAAYFASVLREPDLPGPSVLFLDDREENVAAADRAGLRAAVYDGSDGVPELRRVLVNFGLGI